jgi:hypothetical protein
MLGTILIHKRDGSFLKTPKQHSTLSDNKCDSRLEGVVVGWTPYGKHFYVYGNSLWTVKLTPSHEVREISSSCNMDVVCIVDARVFGFREQNLFQFDRFPDDLSEDRWKLVKKMQVERNGRMGAINFLHYTSVSVHDIAYLCNIAHNAMFEFDGKELKRLQVEHWPLEHGAKHIGNMVWRGVQLAYWFDGSTWFTADIDDIIGFE